MTDSDRSAGVSYGTQPLLTFEGAAIWVAAPPSASPRAREGSGTGKHLAR